MASDNPFTGAVIVAAVATGPSSAKVRQILTDGRVSIGNFYRDKAGEWHARSGGGIFTVDQAKALGISVANGKAVKLSSLTLPEKAPRETKATLSAEVAELKAQLAELLAKAS